MNPDLNVDDPGWQAVSLGYETAWELGRQGMYVRLTSAGCTLSDRQYLLWLQGPHESSRLIELGRIPSTLQDDAGTCGSPREKGFDPRRLVRRQRVHAAVLGHGHKGRREHGRTISQRGNEGLELGIFRAPTRIRIRNSPSKLSVRGPNRIDDSIRGAARDQKRFSTPNALHLHPHPKRRKISVRAVLELERKQTLIPDENSRGTKRSEVHLRPRLVMHYPPARTESVADFQAGGCSCVSHSSP